jgi:hypothetical protein
LIGSLIQAGIKQQDKRYKREKEMAFPQNNGMKPWKKNATFEIRQNLENSSFDERESNKGHEEHGMVKERVKRPVTILALIVSCFLSVGASTLFSSLVSSHQLTQLSGVVERNYLTMTEIVSSGEVMQDNIRTIYEKNQIVGHTVESYEKILEIMLAQQNCRQVEMQNFYIKIYVITKLQQIYSSLVMRKISDQMLTDEAVRHIVRVDPVGQFRL